MTVTRRHIGQTVILSDAGGTRSVVLLDIEKHPRGRFHLARVRFDDGAEWLVSRENLSPGSRYPFGQRCRDVEGDVWERVGNSDRWTQPGVPLNVPRPTTEQLAAYGPFTADEEN